jgi:hypothetical protein
MDLVLTLKKHFGDNQFRPLRWEFSAAGLRALSF